MNTFSPTEISILSDTDFLLQKRAISQRVIETLNGLVGSINQRLNQYQDICSRYNFDSPKISKGENYHGLPYFVLDCPRHFKKSSIFSFRTIIWWGHDISCSLILSGEALTQYAEALIENIPSRSFYFCVNDHPWDHEFETSNYVPCFVLNRNTIVSQIERTGFVKIAEKIDISELEKINTFSTNSLAQFLYCIQKHD